MGPYSAAHSQYLFLPEYPPWGYTTSTHTAWAWAAGLNEIRDFSFGPFSNRFFLLTYSFKLCGIDTDDLCELPKLASLKKKSVICARFLVAPAPQFSNISLLFSGIYYTYTRVTRNLLCLTLEQNRHLPCRLFYSIVLVHQ